MEEVTDPALLKQLNGPGQEVTDPGLLAQLNGTSAPQAPYSFSEFAKDYGSAFVRPIAKAVAGLPLMAMDAGVAARGALTGHVDTSSLKGFLFGSPDTQAALPSSQFNQALDQYTRAPTTTVGKIAEFGSSVLAGAKLPGPTEIGGGAPAAPTGFAPQLLRQAALQKGQAAGYVVPPSTSNPTFMNRLLEGVSGKLKLQQEASLRNQDVTDRLSATGIGQNPDAPITPGALSAIRSDAADSGYAPLAQLGTIPTDATYQSALQKLTQNAQGANRSFQGLAPPSPIDNVVTAMQQPQFEASDGIAAMRYLRSQADDAFRAGRSTEGGAYKSAARAIEDMFERHLQGTGQTDLLTNFTDARQLMAQTYTAGKALSGETGNFNARSYALDLARGKPLVGDQRTIADFATAFPKSAKFTPGESFPSISPLDAYGSAMAAGAAHSAAPLMLPLTRVGIREYLLSNAGQAKATPQAFTPPETMGGLASLGIQVSNYLSQ